LLFNGSEQLGTTLKFTVAQAAVTTPGAYTVLITSAWPTGALGNTTTTTP